MEFELGKAVRKDVYRSWQKKVAAGGAMLGAVLFCLWGVWSVWYWGSLDREMEAALEEQAPLYEAAQEKKAVMEEGRQLYEQCAAFGKERIPWPQVLVVIADTRPDGAALEKIEETAEGIRLTGRAAAADRAVSWQKKLERTGLFTAVRIEKSEKNRRGTHFILALKK